MQAFLGIYTAGKTALDQVVAAHQGDFKVGPGNSGSAVVQQDLGPAGEAVFLIFVGSGVGGDRGGVVFVQKIAVVEQVVDKQRTVADQEREDDGAQ